MPAWDEYHLDVGARRLSGPDGDIHVEPQVFDVLALLVDERHRVVPKAEILDRVWGDQFVSESALATRIKQARRSLGDDGRTQRYIRNVHGRGYQFVGTLLDDGSTGAGGRPEATAGTPPGNTTIATGRVIDLAREIAVDEDFPFVGRNEELATALPFLRRGDGGPDSSGLGIVVIAGTPGVGKSRLAIELLSRAGADGTTTAAGRCEREVTSALQAVRDAFAQVAEADPADLRRWAGGMEGQLLALIPSLARHLDNDPVPVDAYAGIDVFLTAVDRLTDRQPIALLIDDLQWSDEPTRTFLDRVERRLSDRPITIVGTHRTGRADLPAEVARWVGRLTRGANAISVELGRLDTEPARHLVQSVLEDATDDDIDELLAITDANCLFLTEALRDLPYGGETARSIAELIGARVDRQDDEVRRIITAGAALGPEFPFTVAAAAAELDRPRALEAIEQAVEAELLHETGSASRFRFSHQLVPQSIVASLTGARRADLHHRCAIALAEAEATEAEIVVHQLQAIPLVPLDEAVERARTTARAARAANQFDQALRLLRRANDTEPPARTRAELQLEMAQLVNDRGTPAEAIETIEGVANSARTNGWPDLLVSAALAHWSQSPYRRLDDTSTLALLAEASDAVGDDESIEAALVLAKTAAFSVFQVRLDGRLELTDRAIAMARAADAGGLELLTLLEFAAIAATCPAGRNRLAEIDPEIAALREETGWYYFRDAAAPETLALMDADGPAFIEFTGRDPDRVAAQPIAEWRQQTLDGTLAAFEGSWDQAREMYDRAGEIGEAHWGDSAPAVHAFGQFFIDLVSGRWERSAEHLGILTEFSRQAVFLGPYALALHHRGGHDDEIDELLSQVGPQQMRSFPEHIVGGNALVGCGEVAVARDDERLVHLVEAALEPLADQVLGLPWAPSLAAAEVLGRLAAWRGDTERAEAHRRRAADRYRRLAAPALLARVAD